MYLLVEKVEGVSRQIIEGVDEANENVGVRKVVMDGSAVVAERRHSRFVVNAFGSIEMHYVSAFFYSSNKQCEEYLLGIFFSIDVKPGASYVTGTSFLCLESQRTVLWSPRGLNTLP